MTAVEGDEPQFYHHYFPTEDERAARQPAAPVNPLPPDQAGPYATAAINAELGDLASTTEGQRNHRLNRSAYSLAQLVGGGYLDHDATWGALYTVALGIGLTERETLATLRSAFTKGLGQPRQVERRETPTADYEPPAVTVADLPDPALLEVLPDVPPTPRERFPALDWEALWADNSEEEWIVKPLLPARRLVALFSPPKVGKSLLMLELAVAISRGEEVLGYKPDRPRRVLYVDFENDPRGDVRPRLEALGYKPADLTNLFYLSFPRLAMLDTFMGGLDLMSAVQEYECEACVIDTVGRAVGGEENNNDTWLGFYRHTGVLLKAAGVACVRLDHTGKDEAKGMRGGSAKYGDVDAVWAMSRLTDTTFRLECTANRLPITEKILVVEREFWPLRHRVTTRSTGEIIDDEVARLVAALDDLDVPNAAGRGVAEKALAATAIQAPERLVRKAVLVRQARPLPPQDPLWQPGGEP